MYTKKCKSCRASHPHHHRRHIEPNNSIRRLTVYSWHTLTRFLFKLNVWSLGKSARKSTLSSRLLSRINSSKVSAHMWSPRRETRTLKERSIRRINDPYSIMHSSAKSCPARQIYTRRIARINLMPPSDFSFLLFQQTHLPLPHCHLHYFGLVDAFFFTSCLFVFWLERQQENSRM